MKVVGAITAVFVLLLTGCARNDPPPWIKGDWVLDHNTTAARIEEEGLDSLNRGAGQFVQLYETFQKTTFSFRKGMLVEIRDGGNGLVRPFKILSVDRQKIELQWDDGTITTYLGEPEGRMLLFHTNFTRPTVIALKRK